MCDEPGKQVTMAIKWCRERVQRAHWSLGGLRVGLAPFWGGEDGRRRRPAQPVLFCQVLRQKLQSLHGVGALLPEHHHTGLMLLVVACGVGSSAV